MSSSRIPALFNMGAMSRVFGTSEKIIFNVPEKTFEEKDKISCNYQPGDKVLYEWKKGEIRTGIISHIDCAVNINDSVTGKSRSVPLKDVIGYDK